MGTKIRYYANGPDDQDAEIVETPITGTTPIMKEWREIEKLWL